MGFLGRMKEGQAKSFWIVELSPQLFYGYTEHVISVQTLRREPVGVWHAG